MLISDVAELAATLDGVRHTEVGGLSQWRFHGRTVARQLDDTTIVFRSEFDVRDALVAQFPGTFSVPPRFRKHMMIVADLPEADPGAVEDALVAAWDLQRAGG